MILHTCNRVIILETRPRHSHRSPVGCPERTSPPLAHSGAARPVLAVLLQDLRSYLLKGDGVLFSSALIALLGELTEPNNRGTLPPFSFCLLEPLSLACSGRCLWWDVGTKQEGSWMQAGCPWKLPNSYSRCSIKKPRTYTDDRQWRTAWL